jgi:hypothetical protein
MADDRISRRQIFAAAASGLPGLSAPFGPKAMEGRRRIEHEFFVAGVRFQRTIAQGLRLGARLFLQAENVNGGPALAILTANQTKIGYVPKALLPAIGVADHWYAELTAADIQGVPWKRYRVTLYHV